MSAINQLSSVDTLNGSDLLVVFSQQHGDSRKVSLTTLLNFLGLNSSSSDFIHQYSSPASDAFSVTVSSLVPGANIWLILTPSTGFTTGTIVLPSPAIENQEVIITTTQSLDVLILSSPDQIRGAPTALSADSFFRLKFDLLTATWIRVG